MELAATWEADWRSGGDASGPAAQIETFPKRYLNVLADFDISKT
jgi:hypothetical protein